MTLWIKEPTRLIHLVTSVAVVVAAVAADLANALNGTETWVAVAIAVANVVQGELNRSQVRPASMSTKVAFPPGTTPGTPTTTTP